MVDSTEFVHCIAPQTILSTQPSIPTCCRPVFDIIPLSSLPAYHSEDIVNGQQCSLGVCSFVLQSDNQVMVLCILCPVECVVC